MELLNSIKNRWSPRAFKDTPISQEQIDAMFEAARWAPSSFNGQPWRFVYATKENKETWDKLFDALVEFNQNWAKNAYMLVLTTARKTYEHNGKPYKHAWHDVGLAVGNMMNQVTAMGLHMHQMGGFDFEKVRKNINLPDDLEPVSMIAIGYKADPEVLPIDYQDMEKAPQERKDTKDIVFSKSF